MASGAKQNRLISVSASARAQAQRRLPQNLNGVEVVHFSWGDLQRLAKRAQSIASGFEEKLWLRQLAQHLEEFVFMERKTDNRVFVVSLSLDEMVQGQKYSWTDVVVTDSCYFHPVGKGFPVQPPNYVGFRYHGKLESVRHIDSFEIVDNLATVNRLWPVTTYDYFVYKLGPAMKPPREIRTGMRIFRAAQCWCAIDTLLSGEFKTICDARDETKRRMA